MSENNETFFIIQKIESLGSETKRDLETVEDSRKRHLYRKYLLEERDGSLVLLDEFNKFLEIYHFKKSELKALDIKTQEFLNFVLNNRIKKELTYKFVVNLNSQYLLFFFPECPQELLYETFILFRTTIKNIENDMINYLTFIKDSAFKKSIQLSPNIHCYVKINPKYNYVNEFIEKFSYSDEFKLYRIRFDYNREINEYINNSNILVGKDVHYLSSSGTASDLNYILFIKDYFTRII